VVGGLQSWDINGRINCKSRYILYLACTWWVLIYTCDWFVFGFVKRKTGDVLMTYSYEI
jgi:hypothetical protein